MSTIKRTVTIFLAICMAFCFCISADVVMYAKAEGLSIAEGYYIIKGVGSGK